MAEKNESYRPVPAKILSVMKENERVKTFRLSFVSREDNASFSFTPGQFAMFGVAGVGEAPISICSPSFEHKYIEVSIRKAGNVTGAMFGMKKGDTVWVRGPYGRGFPLDECKGRDIVLVAGGIGFPPLASVIDHLARHRKEYGRIWVLYGARDFEDLVFRKRSKRWTGIENLKMLVTVESPCTSWNGCTGMVTDLFSGLDVDGKRTVAMSCGPPVMMKFVTLGLQKMGIQDNDIYLSLERMMQCGIGKCGHCSIGDRHVCTDGPVFRYGEIKNMLERVW